MNYTDHLKEWDDRKAVMAKLRRQGVSIRDIATRYGISTQRVYQILGATPAKAPLRSSPTAKKQAKKQAKYEQSGQGKGKNGTDLGSS
ncbi:MAG: helix-turn-helix domain-containing protein [Candidatus Berkelbacteria bacterium]|nr:helix-turn-helix domain-containing protein [Candidatus Berkelbacteria bacterium]